MDLDSQPESKRISLIKQTICLRNSISDSEPESQMVSRVTQTIPLISSVESEPELMSLSAQIYSYFASVDSDSELTSLMTQIFSHVKSTYSEPPELKLIALSKELMPLIEDTKLIASSEQESKVISLIIEIIALVGSTDLDSLPKPVSELISLTTQTISLFKCANLPQKVRYEHDKHMLTLNYGEETSTMTYLCEVCERERNPKERFYMCYEYRCVTLHIECMLGVDLYIKLDSQYLWLFSRIYPTIVCLDLFAPFVRSVVLTK